MVQNKWQAITLTNDDMIHWYMCDQFLVFYIIFLLSERVLQFHMHVQVFTNSMESDFLIKKKKREID